VEDNVSVKEEPSETSETADLVAPPLARAESTLSPLAPFHAPVSLPHKTDVELEVGTLVALKPHAASLLVKDRLLTAATHVHNDANVHDFGAAIKVCVERFTKGEVVVEEHSLRDLELLGKSVEEICNVLVFPNLPEKVRGDKTPKQVFLSFRKMFEEAVKNEHEKHEKKKKKVEEEDEEGFGEDPTRMHV